MSESVEGISWVLLLLLSINYRNWWYGLDTAAITVAHRSFDKWRNSHPEVSVTKVFLELSQNSLGNIFFN